MSRLAAQSFSRNQLAFKQRRKRLSKRELIASRTYVKRYVKSQQQMHYWNVQTATVIPCDDTATIVDLAAVTQGDTDSNRDGDELKVRKIDLRINWQFNTGGVNPQPGRVMLIQWSGSSSAPTLSEILLVSGAGLAVNSPVNQDNSRANMFKVIMDRRFVASGGGAGGGLMRLTKSKGFNRKIAYLSGGTTGRGKFYLLAIGDTATSTDQPELKYNFIMHFDP